jgi:hypothetical protein
MAADNPEYNDSSEWAGVLADALPGISQVHLNLY